MQKPLINLILLPGMDGTGELFAPFIHALQDYQKDVTINTIVVRYPPNEPLNYEQLTQLASTYIPKNQPYILLGESFSGPIAIALAAIVASANQHLKGLILSSTFARNPRPNLSKLNFMLPTLSINAITIPLAKPFLMANFIDEKVKKLLYQAVPKVSPKVMRARLDAVIGLDYTQSLKQINVPILYLQSTNDYLVPASAGKYILKEAKNVELIKLNAPHLLLQIAPHASAEKVKSFIAKLTH